MRASLAAIEEDRAETVALNESLGAPSPRYMDAHFAGRAGGAPQSADDETDRRVVRSRRRAAAGSLVWAAAAVAVVILLQAAAIISLLPKASDSVPTKTFASASDHSVSSGTEMLVSFAPDARLGDVAAFLKQHDAIIVESPRAGGFYRLKVGRTSLDVGETAALIKSFGEAPIVKMALPVGAK